jgi:hypothetical protein
VHRTIRVGLYADGSPIAVPKNMFTDLSVGNNWSYWLPDPHNAAWGWRVELHAQHMDPLKAMVQERMLGDLWLPIRVRATGADGSMLGDMTPGMLFTGVSDCPSVTWIQGYPGGGRRVLAYQVSLAVISAE